MQVGNREKEQHLLVFIRQSAHLYGSSPFVFFVFSVVYIPFRIIFNARFNGPLALLLYIFITSVSHGAHVYADTAYLLPFTHHGAMRLIVFN